MMWSKVYNLLTSIFLPFQSNSKQPSKIRMESSEYCSYVLLSIFESYYLSWIKDCNAAKFTEDFNNRLTTLSNYLEVASPQYKERSSYINFLAKKKSFDYKRKLSLSIDSVGFGDNNQTSTSTAIQVRFLTRTSINSNNYDLYNCRVILRIENDYKINLDIPIEMNDPKTKMSIEFLYITGNQIKETYTSRSEAFHTVKEYEISGFSGHSKAFKFVDAATGKEVIYQLNIRWDLASESLLENISCPQVIVEHFSKFMLSVGSYFWRFYSGLYTQLLVYNRTQAKAIKMLNEIFFVIGSSNRAKLIPMLFHLLQESNHSLMECNSEECVRQFKLFHSILLCFEQLNEEYQSKLVDLFYLKSFVHYMRISCQFIPKKHQSQLGRILLRRFNDFLKKRKHLNSVEKNAYINIFHLYGKYLTTWLNDITGNESGESVEMQANISEVLENFIKIEKNEKKKKIEKKGSENEIGALASFSTDKSDWSTKESSSWNEKTSDMETTGTEFDSDISDSAFDNTKERDIKHELVINGKPASLELENKFNNLGMTDN